MIMIRDDNENKKKYEKMMKWNLRTVSKKKNTEKTPFLLQLEIIGRSKVFILSIPKLFCHISKTNRDPLCETLSPPIHQKYTNPTPQQKKKNKNKISVYLRKPTHNW